ncbi:ABC transporter ATP-binding protein [Actinoplanes friuliensis]|jgi:ABC-2 type transport system ATP-binding protein|uniref:ABC transporter ATP-binding protein n=1 Tax=Actinoplanes friuliensis DSM 7358 TaxID=1246995 RepID=U5VWH5_9ACTN|nr:ABC transporter ATP-binding protein [Actinoplanes friuliensis]AGZ40045.1 ABC transporter ATP-binding protein [Actinoplanes friuliensis DSM 7358]
MADTAISTEDLVKTYGRGSRGLAGLDLEVRTNEVYGYLGPNGAGKSTTIRILLDLIRPTGGSVRVLGLDPRTDGVALRRRVGYLAGDFVVDGRQTSRQLLAYLGKLRGGVPAARITGLADRLGLDLDRPIRGLSKGNRQKAGIVQAFMHSPELLVLDEPTSGLDPFLQQEFVHLVQEARREGATVFMSSHVMSEVQQTADRVGIIRDGRLVAVESVESLRAHALRSVTLTFDGEFDAAVFDRLPGFTDLSVTGATLHGRLSGHTDELLKAASRYTVLDLLCEEPDLEEIFFHYYALPEAGHVAA